MLRFGLVALAGDLISFVPLKLLSMLIMLDIAAGMFMDMRYTLPEVRYFT